jgi:hypothetical protein
VAVVLCGWQSTSTSSAQAMAGIKEKTIFIPPKRQSFFKIKKAGFKPRYAQKKVIFSEKMR